MICFPARGDLLFGKNSGDSSYSSEDDICVPLEPEEWTCVSRGIDVFPAGEGYGEAYLDLDYPDYIFFGLS